MHGCDTLVLYLLAQISWQYHSSTGCTGTRYFGTYFPENSEYLWVLSRVPSGCGSRYPQQYLCGGINNQLLGSITRAHHYSPPDTYSILGCRLSGTHITALAATSVLNRLTCCVLCVWKIFAPRTADLYNLFLQFMISICQAKQIYS